MTDNQFPRNKNITLVYKNLVDGSMKSEQLKGRTTEEFHTIAAGLPQVFSRHPYLYLHRREGDEMNVTSVELLKKFGTESKQTLHCLVYVEYVIDPDVV